MADRPPKQRDSRVSQATNYGQASSKTKEKSVREPPSRTEPSEGDKIPSKEKGKQRANGEETRPPKPGTGVGERPSDNQRITRSKSRTAGRSVAIEEVAPVGETEVEE